MTKGQRCLCYCSYFTPGLFVSKECGTDTQPNTHSKSSGGTWVDLTMVTCSPSHHVLVQGPLMCG